jgi:hypothetical protein
VALVVLYSLPWPFDRTGVRVLQRAEAGASATRLASAETDHSSERDTRYQLRNGKLEARIRLRRDSRLVSDDTITVEVDPANAARQLADGVIKAHSAPTEPANRRGTGNLG